jgi:hypothetical protein
LLLRIPPLLESMEKILFGVSDLNPWWWADWSWHILMQEKERIARRAHNSHPVTRERRTSRILATASERERKRAASPGGGFLKREVLKPATGKDQTKFFVKEIQMVRAIKGQ